MFEDIKKYMQKNIEERKLHLNLNEECLEIGGMSTEFRGLLAHFLHTTIPFKNQKIVLCHACNNGNCSNPKHLYWGTSKENFNDQIENGTWDTISNRTIKKIGDKNYKALLSSAGKQGGINGGGSNKFSIEEIKEKLSSISDVDVMKFGWVNIVSKRWNISHTQVRRFMEQHFDGTTYKR